MDISSSCLDGPRLRGDQYRYSSNCCISLQHLQAAWTLAEQHDPPWKAWVPEAAAAGGVLGSGWEGDATGFVTGRGAAQDVQRLVADAGGSVSGFSQACKPA